MKIGEKAFSFSFQTYLTRVKQPVPLTPVEIDPTSLPASALHERGDDDDGGDEGDHQKRTPIIKRNIWCSLFLLKII